MALTPEQLKNATGCSLVTAQEVVGALNAAMQAYGINTPARISAFLAQVAHESGLFTRRTENLNYSAERLLQVFPKYFTTAALAAKYGRKPELIANRVYANRMGNGGEASGDGWRYRGRGYIQLTGRDNYAACDKALGAGLLASPEKLETVEMSALSAAWYWNKRGCNKLADEGRFTDICKVINGGRIGLEERVALFNRAQGALA